MCQSNPQVHIKEVNNNICVCMQYDKKGNFVGKILSEVEHRKKQRRKRQLSPREKKRSSIFIKRNVQIFCKIFIFHIYWPIYFIWFKGRSKKTGNVILDYLFISTEVDEREIVELKLAKEKKMADEEARIKNVVNKIKYNLQDNSEEDQAKRYQKHLDKIKKNKH